MMNGNENRIYMYILTIARFYESIYLLFLVNFPSIQQGSMNIYKRIHVIPGDAGKLEMVLCSRKEAPSMTKWTAK